MQLQVRYPEVLSYTEGERATSNQREKELPGNSPSQEENAQVHHFYSDESHKAA